ncbi:60s ribosomal protein l37 [Quercus suber]|uniref:60s ribosomal protein l37 n=1 Tax=Quercus suber TaxID=58331 RepID=A0AAW0LIJ5_QUESU
MLINENITGANSMIFVANSLNNWSEKAIRRKTTGTGRKRYLRYVAVRFKHNFRQVSVFLGLPGRPEEEGSISLVLSFHSRFAKKTFIAAPRSSLDKASSSGYSDAWLPVSQTLPIMRRPTSGIGSTREAHRSLVLQGSRSSGIEGGCTIAFVDRRVISLAKATTTSYRASTTAGMHPDRY